MTNHAHLMIETGDITISEIMRRFNLLYTKYFTIKYNLVGHLLLGRYFADLVESDSHILKGNRYIHLNPVRAKMIDLPEEFECSSYEMFIGLKNEKMVTSEKVLSNWWYKVPLWGRIEVLPLK